MKATLAAIPLATESLKKPAERSSRFQHFDSSRELIAHFITYDRFLNHAICFVAGPWADSTVCSPRMPPSRPGSHFANVPQISISSATPVNELVESSAGDGQQRAEQLQPLHEKVAMESETNPTEQKVNEGQAVFLMDAIYYSAKDGAEDLIYYSAKDGVEDLIYYSAKDGVEDLIYYSAKDGVEDLIYQNAKGHFFLFFRSRRRHRVRSISSFHHRCRYQTMSKALSVHLLAV